MNIHLPLRPGTRRKLAGAFGLLLTLGLLVSLALPPALAASIPGIGHQFWGTVKIDGANAPDGTMVYAKINGTAYFQQATVAGQYGYAAEFIVPPDDPETVPVEGGNNGDTISFFVGTKLATTYTFAKTARTELNLAVTVAAPTTYNLTVTSSGCCTVTVGSLGTVAAGATQTFTTAANTPVQVTANTTQCCQFVNWVVNSGAPTTTNPLTIPMDNNYTAVATCNMLGPYTLTRISAPLAGGTVTATPASDSGSYSCGASVTLHYQANSGYEFTGWGGDLNGTENDKTLVMNGNKSVTGNFQLIQQGGLPGAIMAIPLNVGWNTFSTPIAMSPTMDTWGEFVAVNSLSVDLIYGYNSDSGLWEMKHAEDALAPLAGFYVKMAAAGSAQIVPNPGQSGPPMKHLPAGLNLVGVASLVNVDVASYLKTVYDVPNTSGYTLVHNPPINVPNDWTNNIYLRDGTPVPTMKVGKAYWVNMLHPGDLVGFTSTPLPSP